MAPVKRRKLSPPDDDDTNASSASKSALTSSFAKNAAHWNLEQDYENRPRKQKKQKENVRLPIKTLDGLIEQYQEPENDESDRSESSFGSLEDETADTEQLDEESPRQEHKPVLSQRDQIIQAKEELARVASLINEDPEEHIGGLRTLAQIAASQNSTVTKLGLVTQCAVFKDIIPGYRIRPWSEKATNGKVSKEVRKLQGFEQSVVGNYHKYVKELQRISALPRSSEEAASLRSVAVRCSCDMIKAVPHFNFRTELLGIIVSQISRRSVDSDFALARETIETLFSDDEEGDLSLEAVGLLAKMIKSKSFQLHESVVNMFLSLRLLSEFSHKGSTQKISKDADEEADGRPQRLSNKEMKKRKERMSKKEKKAMKERREIEEEMKEADATVAHEQRDHNQGETLKLVFGIYFRILKARVPQLTGAVLEGLVKFAHLINQDFFGDLLEALRELVQEAEVEAQPEELDDGDDTINTEDSESSRNLTRESLLCVITAFALLQGQDASKASNSLHLDLDFFTTQLYRTLYPAALNADIELSDKSLHLADPHAPQDGRKTKVNVQTTIVLLVRSLTAVLLPGNARSVPPVRLAAFAKQILTSTLHLPEKSATAMTGLLAQTAKVHKKKITALWHTEERRGDGVFDPLREQIEGSNPFAATVWEGELLRLHYAPSVRDGVKNLESLIGVP